MENQGQLYFGLFLTSDTLLMAIILLSSFLLLAVIISMMRIYKKCGKPSISAIIPIWSQIALFQIVGKPWWYLLLCFIPIVNIVILIQAYIGLAKRFGKGALFAIGMLILPMIYIPLLSFYDYIGDESSKVQEELEPVYNPFNETNVEQVMPEAPINSVVEDKGDNSVQDEVINDIPLVQETSVESVEIKNDANIPVVGVLEENQDLTEIPVVQMETLEEPEIINVNENIVNPTVQDIEDALNIKKDTKDIAFNSAPISFEKNEEVVEKIDNEVQDEVIELPEIAAKVCPACGVSLADDIKFCTSCGTKI